MSDSLAANQGDNQGNHQEGGGREERRIIHVDMDAFYAAIEQRDFPEKYAGEPIAVGGRSPRGVVQTASYEARPCGVHSAQPATQADRKCPDLISVPPRMEVHKEESRAIRQILRRYTDLVEPLSLDEAYLDVTDPKIGPPSGTLIAKRIREEIREETGLTASAGVGPSKFVAKVAPERDLRHHFGKRGGHFKRLAMGAGDRPVKPDRERRSVGAERTFREDISEPEEMLRRLETIAEKVEHRLTKAGPDGGPALGRTVTLKLKSHEHETSTRQTTLERAVAEKRTSMPSPSDF